nr:MAG TPA: hypothetical protein [Caudoviricetes sp.]
MLKDYKTLRYFALFLLNLLKYLNSIKICELVYYTFSRCFIVD